MITISLCMIVKNEEKVLARCLESAKGFADEIIIVDTGSQDRTKEIARAYTEKIYDFSWKDDFSAARNESFSKASMDYCMWLDADDVVTEENQGKLKVLKERLDPDTDMVMMKYAISETQDGKALFSYYRERLVKNKRGFLWAGRVHEAISPEGKVVYSEITISHRKEGQKDPGRNLRIYEKMEKEGEAFDGRSRFYYGRELMAHGRYSEGIKTLEAFLEGEGWTENNRGLYKPGGMLPGAGAEGKGGEGADGKLPVRRTPRGGLLWAGKVLPGAGAMEGSDILV